MRIFIVAFVCVLGCTKQNPDVCCIDASDCAQQGLSTITPCGDGLLCRGNQCIAEPCTNSVACDVSAPYCVAEFCGASCTVDGQCPGFGQDPSRQFCVTGSCQQCRVGMNDCPTNAPVCDAGSCRTCGSDDECPSTVCDLSVGACVPASSILYAATDGADAAVCSQAAPCTLEKAVSLAGPQHSWVRANPGTYAANVTTANAFTLVGTGATTTGVSVSTNGNVVIRGLGIQTAVCNAAGVSALALDSLSVNQGVAGCVGPNCLGGGCRFSMRRVNLGPGEFYLASNARVTIDRSQLTTLHLSTEAGTALFSIQIKNSLARALDLAGLVASAGTSIDVEYNTFYNTQGLGVVCGTDATTPTGIAFVNNIFNSPLSSDSIASSGTKCVFDTNVAYPQATVLGTNTIRLDPKLVDPANHDFHLSPTSPAVDAAKTTFDEPTVDYDGTPRPQGARRDIGALEYK